MMYKIFRNETPALECGLARAPKEVVYLRLPNEFYLWRKAVDRDDNYNKMNVLPGASSK